MDTLKDNKIGTKINYFTIVEELTKPNSRYHRFKCRCICGNEVILKPHQIFSKWAHKSCGCKTKEIIRLKSVKHGHRHTRLYNIWEKMKQRCYNKNNKLYSYYGGRGIKICQTWINDFGKFYNWSMKNGYKNCLTLDRINVNGNYSARNCRWVTMSVQCNNKRNNVLLTYKNKTQNLSQWCKELGLPMKLIHGRIRVRKMSVEEAFEKPVPRSSF